MSHSVFSWMIRKISHPECVLSESNFIRLAAVDMHTAQHIVENCLSGGLAKDRTIILVTHHITLCLPIASHLVELQSGKILHQGSIQELRGSGILEAVISLENESDTLQDSPRARTPENEADPNKRPTAPQRRQSDGKLIDAEARAEGRVAFRTYVTYIKAAGLFSWLLTVVLMLLIRFINIGNQVRHFHVAYTIFLTLDRCF